MTRSKATAAIVGPENTGAGLTHQADAAQPADRSVGGPLQTDIVGGPTSRTLLGSVRKAARVLRTFTHADQELGVSEIARRLGLGTSTAHRLIATLEAERLLEQDGLTGKYRLSLALLELGRTVTSYRGLREAGLSVIHELRQRTGEMVQVAVLDGGEVVYIERLESEYLLPILAPLTLPWVPERA